MSIRGSNFENQHPFASDHALVWAHCMPDGLLYGVDMSFTSTLFTLGTGFMLVAGRMFEITATENISISPGSGYARVYVAIDTGGTASENSFDQVSFGVDYAANLDSFPELTQGEININQGAAVYQAEVAVLAINSSGVTAIERQMELVSPGAGTGAFAAIAITYPAGSTVTVTDGKITYTAPNTNGSALFIIPYAATWIVTATDGTNTKSESVEITSEGQSVSVELSYSLWLYKDGDTCDSVTGGWTSFTESSDNRVNFNSDNIYTYGKYVKTQHGAAAYAYPNRKIDLSKYASLRAKVSGVSYNSACQCGIMVNNSLTNVTNGVVSNHDELADFTAAAAASNGEISIDISTLEGEYYVLIGVTYGTANGASSLTCAEMWLA